MEYYSADRAWGSSPYTKFGNSRSFHLTLVSVNKLQCKRRIGKEIRVYAEVQLDYRPATTTNKYVVADGQNLTLGFPVHYAITNESGGNLVVRLYYERSVWRTSIGVANIDLTKLFHGWRDNRQHTKTYELPKGNLKIAYRFA